MSKAILALAIGILIGSHFQLKEDNKVLDRTHDRYKRKLSDSFSHAYRTGVENATEEAARYHQIYHQDCTSRFCPK